MADNENLENEEIKKNPEEETVENAEVTEEVNNEQDELAPDEIEQQFTKMWKTRQLIPLLYSRIR